MTEKPFVIQNFYSLLGSKLDVIKNPYTLLHPSIILLVAQTGSGKTAMIPNLIEQMGGFDRIICFTGTSCDELIYNTMKEEFQDQFEMYVGFSSFLKIINEIKNAPDLEKEKIMLIVDDFLGESNRVKEMLAQFGTWSRKTTKAGLTYVILAQSFFDIPTLLRAQCQYIFMLRGFDKRQITAITSRFSCGDLQTDDIFNMYQDALSEGRITDVFLIDKKTKCINLKFRKGFECIYVIDPSKPSTREDLLEELNRG
jgi:hypothetical protein